MTLDVKPEIAAALEALASAKGLSVEDCLEQLLQRESRPTVEANDSLEGSGMVWENGLFVYRTGKPLPSDLLDAAIREVREERSRRLLGNNS